MPIFSSRDPLFVSALLKDIYRSARDIGKAAVEAILGQTIRKNPADDPHVKLRVRQSGGKITGRVAPASKTADLINTIRSPGTVAHTPQGPTVAAQILARNTPRRPIDTITIRVPPGGLPPPAGRKAWPLKKTGGERIVWRSRIYSKRANRYVKIPGYLEDSLRDLFGIKGAFTGKHGKLSRNVNQTVARGVARALRKQGYTVRVTYGR